MALSGSLDLMPLPELFQWAGMHGKYGMLEVSQGRTRVQFAFDGGRITGCASDDPPSLLGQFLLAHGKIDEKTLQEALLRQEREGGLLGDILTAMGVVSREVLERCLRAKAEETIFKLFDWRNAEFRFDPELQPMSKLVRLDLEVEEILERGAERRVELDRMKSVFTDPGVVLIRTAQPHQPDGVKAPMARRLYELVDGKRTFGEIVLLSRAPEFLAMKFLFELNRRGIIAVKDVHDTPPEPGSPEAACELAERLAARGEDEAAMEILEACQQEHPRHEGLQRLLSKLETGYLDRVYASEIHPDHVPHAKRSPDEVRDSRLSSNELFLFEMIHENPADVRSIIRIAPLHEIDVIRALRRLLKELLIEMREGEPVEQEPAARVDTVVQSLGTEIEQSLGILDGIDPATRPAKRA